MNNESSNTGIIIGILVVVVIGIVAWIAYTQGFFAAKDQAKDSGSLQIDLGGSSKTSDAK
jgi:hypothetical protein